MNPKDNESKYINIVVIDDESKVRDQITAYIMQISKKNTRKPRIFPSSHGVEGLGLIYSIDPNVIIMDLSLPQYTGKEIVEFLESNPKYSHPEKNVIILNDGLLNRKFPENFRVVEKSDPNFLEEIKSYIIID